MRLARRIAVHAVDALFACALLVLAVTATTQRAQAYVDPSVMTYTIQALAGVAVALSAVLGVVWRRVRKHLLRALRIDENANKVVEPAVRAMAADDPARDELLAQARSGAERARRELGTVRPERLCWGTRLVFALVASSLLSFTVLVVAPIEIVASSSSSLFFGVGNVWQPVALFAAAVAVALALLMSALRGRAFNVAFALVIALGVSAYVQAMLLNTGLPPADGNAVVWDSYTKITVGSAAVWLGILALCVALSLKRSLAFKGAASFATLLLVVAQSIGLAQLLSQPTDDGSTLGAEKPYVTMQGMMDVSEKSNVVMFVLDTFDTRYLNDLLATHPDALAEMTGFTYYPDSVGSMIPTRYAMASLVTGRSLTAEDPAFSNSLLRSWYADNNLLDEANRLGYSVGVYASDMPQGMTALSEKTINVHSIPSYTGSFADTVGILTRCALYRDLPWAAKPAFWFYTDELNNAITPSRDTEQGLDNIPYLLDDPTYYQDLTSHGLSADDTGEKGAFRIIHLEGSHFPYNMDENAQAVDEGVSAEQQRLGALKIVSEYLRQMKELGVYDQSTIIITADHGEWYLSPDITGSTSPMLLVKPAGAADEPVAVSDAATGHMDLPATIVGAMGGDASAWGTPVEEAPGLPRQRTYRSTAVEGDDFTYTWIKEWAVDGNVLDWESWEKTDQQWPIVSD